MKKCKRWYASIIWQFLYVVNIIIDGQIVMYAKGNKKTFTFGSFKVDILHSNVAKYRK